MAREVMCGLVRNMQVRGPALTSSCQEMAMRAMRSIKTREMQISLSSRTRSMTLKRKILIIAKAKTKTTRSGSLGVLSYLVQIVSTVLGKDQTQTTTMIWIKNYLAKMTLREMRIQMEQQEKTVQTPTLTNMQHSQIAKQVNRQQLHHHGSTLNKMLILLSRQDKIKQILDTKDF